MPNQHRQAATAELREFLAQMRGKSPKEMLGAIANSNLVQSTLIATAAVTAALVVLTIVPFGVDKIFSANADKEKTETPQPGPAGKLETPAEPSLDDIDNGSAASKLGIGDSKEAPTNVNPLEGTTGDLLEGLE